MAEVISIKDILAPSFYRPYNDFITGRKTTICLSGGRGCVDGDTEILTEHGYEKVREFKGGLVWSREIDGAYVLQMADPPTRYTVEKMYRVTLANGRSVIVTDEHRFLRWDSRWVMTKDLTVGQDALVCMTNFKNQFYNETSIVVGIEFVKEDYYYDFNVSETHNYISNGIVSHNSTKSSFISVCIFLGLERARREALKQKLAGNQHWKRLLVHAICFRKVANTLADSVYAQFQWAAEKLHLTDKYIFRKTPLMIERRGTGQRIMFRGLDDPMRTRSVRPPFSYFSMLWAEELSEYDGMEEILDVQRSVQRGGHDYVTFFSYNPPETSANWVNQRIAEIAREDPTFGFYKSDYRSVPRAWLGDKFFHDADILRRINERAYRHQYLGEVTGNGGTVFPNVVPVTLSDEDIAKFDRIRFGVDFGMVDPTVMMAIYYDRLHHAIYIFDEIYKSNMTVDEMEREFKQMHDVKYKSWEYIIADCAGSTLILSLRQKGLKMLPCKKGPDSIMAGVKWLQSLTGIYIDGRRCPNALREFQLYEYEKLRDNSFSDRLPDRNNHTLDACLDGDTIVWTPTGQTRIRDMVETEGKLFGVDEEGIIRSVPYCHCRKTRENAEVMELFITGRGSVICTPDHRILTPNGYREAMDLFVGDQVSLWDGVGVVEKVSCDLERRDVYDLEVPNTHNFVVNDGIIGHNCRYSCEGLITKASMFG